MCLKKLGKKKLNLSLFLSMQILISTKKMPSFLYMKEGISGESTQNRGKTDRLRFKRSNIAEKYFESKH